MTSTYQTISAQRPVEPVNADFLTLTLTLYAGVVDRALYLLTRSSLAQVLMVKAVKLDMKGSLPQDKEVGS